MSIHISFPNFSAFLKYAKKPGEKKEKNQKKCGQLRNFLQKINFVLKKERRYSHKQESALITI